MTIKEKNAQYLVVIVVVAVFHLTILQKGSDKKWLWIASDFGVSFLSETKSIILSKCCASRWTRWRKSRTSSNWLLSLPKELCPGLEATWLEVKLFKEFGIFYQIGEQVLNAVFAEDNDWETCRHLIIRFITAISSLMLFRSRLPHSSVQSARQLQGSRSTGNSDSGGNQADWR